MIPISISDFIAGMKIPVDLYVRLNDDKFVLVAKGGTITNVDQLKNYQEREVDYVWAVKKEYFKLTSQSLSLAGIIVSQNDIDFKSKTTVLSSAAKFVFNELQHMGISLEMYNNARQITDATIGLCENHKDLAALFESLKYASDQLVTHSMAVSAVSVLLGTQMGWEKKTTLEKLAMGGLLHDMGLKLLPSELLKKPLAQYTAEENQLYETHPYRAMQMLLSLGIVPEDIISIVYEHHETSIGTGFPQRVRDVKLHPLGKIVALADQFVDLTMANINCPNPKRPREALMYIEHTMGLPFNREAFRALRRMVEQYNPPAAKKSVA